MDVEFGQHWHMGCKSDTGGYHCAMVMGVEGDEVLLAVEWNSYVGIQVYPVSLELFRDRRMELVGNHFDCPSGAAKPHVCAFRM